MEFDKLKLEYVEIFTEIICVFELLQGIGQNIDPENPIFKVLRKNMQRINFQKIVNYLKKNSKTLKRSKMKCVTFGKTSGGKSAVINRLLRHDLLPSGSGRSTACFISVENCDEDEGFVKVGDERRDISLMNTLVDEYSEDKWGVNKILNVFLPKTFCDLLRNDVEIVDSPGVDYLDDTDLWIKEYCEDADVFILVVDGDTTLNKNERKFFSKVKMHISKPDIFVLFNKWDTVKTKEKTRKQQQDVASTFFFNLGISLRNERVFFVSALNMLNGSGNDEFMEFEKALKEHLNENAIHTKLEKYGEQGLKQIKFIKEKLTDFQQCGIKRESCLGEEYRKQLLVKFEEFSDSTFRDICKKSKKIILKNNKKLFDCIRKPIKEEIVLIEKLIIYTMDYLVNDIFGMFYEHIDTLQERFKNILVQESCSIEQIKRYFSSNLKESICQYQQSIKTSFYSISEKFIIKVKTNKFLENFIWFFKALIGYIKDFFSKNTDKSNKGENTDTEFHTDFNNYFNDAVINSLTKIRPVVGDFMENILDKYITDESKMNDVCSEFEELKIKCENIGQKLKENHSETENTQALLGKPVGNEYR